VSTLQHAMRCLEMANLCIFCDDVDGNRHSWCRSRAGTFPSRNQRHFRPKVGFPVFVEADQVTLLKHHMREKKQCDTLNTESSETKARSSMTNLACHRENAAKIGILPVRAGRRAR